MTGWTLHQRLMATLLVFSLVYAVALLTDQVLLTPGTMVLADADLAIARATVLANHARGARTAAELAQGLPVLPRASIWLEGPQVTWLARAWEGVGLSRHQAVALSGTPYVLHVRAYAPLGLALFPDLNSALRISTAIALFLVFWGATAGTLSRQLRRGLEQLSLGFAQFAAGNFNYRIPALRDRELAEAAAEFNQLAQRLEAAQRQARQAENALRAAHAHKKQTLGMVSHELRTPLTSILGYAAMLPEGAPGLEAAARGLLTRLERLLEWSRLDAGRLDLAREEFELNEVLEYAVHASEQHPEVELSGEAVLLEGDFRWLSRALESLLRLLRPARLKVEGGALWLLDTAPPPADQDLPLSEHLSWPECAQVIAGHGGVLERTGSAVRVALLPLSLPGEDAAP